MPGCGPVRLTQAMVLKFGGCCSFCGKRSEEVVGLAGVTGKDVRICNECLDLCCEIIGFEEQWADLGRKPPARAAELAQLSASQIGPWLSRHYGCPFLDVTDIELVEKLVWRIPSHVVRDFGVLPVDRSGRTLVLAMADPSNATLRRSIARNFDAEIEVVVSTRTAIQKAYDRHIERIEAATRRDVIKHMLELDPEDAVKRALAERASNGEELALSELIEAAGVPAPAPRPPDRSRRPITLSCSFCGKNSKEVLKLIAGPTVYVCDGCVGDGLARFAQQLMS